MNFSSLIAAMAFAILVAGCGSRSEPLFKADDQNSLMGQWEAPCKDMSPVQNPSSLKSSISTLFIQTGEIKGRLKYSIQTQVFDGSRDCSTEETAFSVESGSLSVEGSQLQVYTTNTFFGFPSMGLEYIPIQFSFSEENLRLFAPENSDSQQNQSQASRTKNTQHFTRMETSK